ncbi:hypothetical protein RBQ61_04655 [Sedimentibacter sp. MB35-C1]|uniref:hypothetical protein n=2 Tax=unclassified Sedimentibacter TaxID=2649220 RepID=UPI0027DF3CFA|nr:hypothetical protein [Sedimentibacter sp. MB35-C1]WMJ78224.1 hypothetical protein RBQ61_04655 [Sedimentibacter sp. MB35-C1]
MEETRCAMVNILKLRTIINKDRTLKRLHIKEGTEVFKSADSIFEEVSRIIRNSLQWTAVYKVVDSLDIKGVKKHEKYVVCFVSAKGVVAEMSHNLMSSGQYMKGYLLHETALDAMFDASNEMNKIINNEASKAGLGLSKRYAPGDGDVDLDSQRCLIDMLKMEAEIDAYLNEKNIITPESSLLYILGMEKCKECMKNAEECACCSNDNCQYRRVHN